MISFSSSPILPRVVHQALGNLRLHLGEKLGLISPDVYRFVWILDFPLLEYDETEKRYRGRSPSVYGSEG